MKVTMQNLSWENQRVSLPAPLWEGKRDYGTGVTLRALFYGPKSHRWVIETYSIWNSGNGTVVGTRYIEIDESEALRLCDRLDVEVPKQIPVEVL